jgi:hypothetical protein
MNIIIYIYTLFYSLIDLQCNYINGYLIFILFFIYIRLNISYNRKMHNCFINLLFKYILVFDTLLILSKNSL